MSVTVLESLENAEYNLKALEKHGEVTAPIFMVALSQLSSALEAINSGKDLYDTLEEANEE